MTNLDPEAKAALRRTMRMALAAGWVAISAAGWLRMAESLRLRDWLELAGVQPNPDWLAVGGAVWGMISVTAAILLWLNSAWAVLGSRIAAAALVILFWIDRLALSQSETAAANRWYEIGVTVLLSGLVWLMTWVMQQVRLIPDEERVKE